MNNYKLAELDKIQDKIADYELKIKANDLLWEAFRKIKHHKNLTKAIKTEFEKIAPNYQFSYGIQYEQFHISLWGNGIDYNNRLFYCFSLMDQGTIVSWQFAFERQLAVNDNRDYKANLENEIAYLPELDRISQEIAKLRKQAKELKPANIPKEAELRNEPCYWQEFSYITQGIYPEIFKD